MATGTTIQTETEAEAAIDRPRRRWRLAVLPLAVAVAGLWWAGTTDPLAPGSGGYGVRSDVAPVASIDVTGADTSYVATYVEGERVTLLFPLTNTGRLPVRVVEVFPADLRIVCGWVPDRVETSPSTVQDYRPFEPFWLPPGEIVDLAVSGTFGCEGREAVIQALASYDGVPVRWSAAGVVPRTTRVPTGYRFGWTTTPEEVVRVDVDRDAAVTDP